MKVSWLSSALAELDHVHDYIARQNPKAAARVFVRIRDATQHLPRFPGRGRPGHVAGTRELVVTGLPFVVVYRVTEDSVEIVRVLHTSVDRPPGTMQ